MQREVKNIEIKVIRSWGNGRMEGDGAVVVASEVTSLGLMFRAGGVEVRGSALPRPTSR